MRQGFNFFLDFVQYDPIKKRNKKIKGCVFFNVYFSASYLAIFYLLSNLKKVSVKLSNPLKSFLSLDLEIALIFLMDTSGFCDTLQFLNLDQVVLLNESITFDESIKLKRQT